MTPRKLKVGFARFPYAGNGGRQAEHPSIADWLVDTVLKIVKDERIDKEIWKARIADTPIPMSRNRAFKEALAAKVDVLVMIDSDQVPDLYHAYGGKPFWDTSFDLIYRHYDRGPCVVAAPYCGPPPHPLGVGEELVYIFQWTNNSSDPKISSKHLAPIEREEAARRMGFEKVAAAPTGLMMCDMRLVEKCPKPLFAYEWVDPPWNSRKASTEDVYFTRNCSLCGVPVYCNWDSWAGHDKSEIVGKPKITTVDDMSESFRKALEQGYYRDEKVVDVNADISTEELVASLGGRMALREPKRNGHAGKKAASGTAERAKREIAGKIKGLSRKR